MKMLFPKEHSPNWFNRIRQKTKFNYLLQISIETIFPNGPR